MKTNSLDWEKLMTECHSGALRTARSADRTIAAVSEILSVQHHHSSVLSVMMTEVRKGQDQVAALLAQVTEANLRIEELQRRAHLLQPRPLGRLTSCCLVCALGLAAGGVIF